MLLKTILIVVLALSFGEARETELVPLQGYYTPGYYADGSMDILLRYGSHSKDWIGIYKAGTSNAWKNVISWKWSQDMSSGFACPTKSCDSVYERFLRVQLEDGDYEARFFKDNSFILDQKLAFTVKAVDSFVKKISSVYDAYENRLYMRVYGISENVPAGKKDWIGLYKVGDSNDWGNVRKWDWANDKLSRYAGHTDWNLDGIDLETGDYELRYFLRNSFVTHKKSPSFHVIKESQNPILKNNLLEDLGNYLDVTFKNASGNPKDWFGIFKKGAVRNRENILLWRYNIEGKKNGRIRISLFEDNNSKNLKIDEDYDIVWFENDSYNVLAESTLFVRHLFGDISGYFPDIE